MAPEQRREHGDGDRDPDLTDAGPAQAGPARVPRALSAACVVVGVEALALAGLAAFLVVDTILGRASHAAFGLLSAVFALAGAAILYLGARGLGRLSAAARTPVVVLQVLALPVAYTMAFQAHLAGVGGPIFLAALTVLYLLFTPPVRAVLDRDAPL